MDKRPFFKWGMAAILFGEDVKQCGSQSFSTDPSVWRDDSIAVTIKGEIYQDLLTFGNRTPSVISQSKCRLKNFFFFSPMRRDLTQRFADDSKTWHIYGSTSVVQVMFMSLILGIIRA